MYLEIMYYRYCSCDIWPFLSEILEMNIQFIMPSCELFIMNQIDRSSVHLQGKLNSLMFIFCIPMVENPRNWCKQTNSLHIHYLRNYLTNFMNMCYADFRWNFIKTLYEKSPGRWSISDPKVERDFR